MEVVYQLIFFKDALKDINYWKKSGNKQAINKIDKIIEVLEQNPYNPRLVNPKC
jgi:Txe/YoeB family toxin of Txe-Axe toxin-antitoxin module